MPRPWPLVVSLALHALAGLLLVRAGAFTPTQATRAPEATLEVEILSDAAQQAIPPPPEPELRPAQPRSRRVRELPPAPPVVPESPVAARPPLPRAPVSLALDYAAVDRLTRTGLLARPEAPPPAPEAAPPPSKHPTFNQRLAARVRDVGARRNVEAGKVHPQLFDYMRSAREVFAPDPAIVDLDPRTPNTVGRSMHQWGKGLSEAYRSWRRELDSMSAQRRRDDPDRRGATDILDGYNRLLEGTKKGADAIASQVCLMVQPGGTAQAVLGASSGNAEVDRAAIDALTRAARRRPVDPDVKKQRTCYRFSVTVSRVPPIPIAGCTFDEVELTASCYYPTMKSMTISVSLESVDYDG